MSYVIVSVVSLFIGCTVGVITLLENNLPTGGKDKTVTKEQFLKMGYNERMKLKQENPELFKQLNTH